MTTRQPAGSVELEGEDLRRRVAPLLSPAVERSIERLRHDLAKHARPIAEVQRELAQALGARRLSDELQRARDG